MFEKYHVGSTIKLESIEILGHPPPKIQWLFNGTDWSNFQNMFVINEQRSTTLTVQNAQRGQSGIYKLLASNEHGQDELEVEVKVIGRPSSPSGPLSVSYMGNATCRIHWNPPLENGGDPIQSYRMEYQIYGRQVWKTCGQTKGALDLETSPLPRNSMVKFRVKAVNSVGESDPLEGPEDSVFIRDLIVECPGRPGLPTILNTSQSEVHLEWSAPKRGSNLTYLLEYREDGEDQWISGPKVHNGHLRGQIGGLTSRKKYEFRVRALNSLGQQGQASESTTPYLVKEKGSAPKIDKSKLGIKSLKVGRQEVVCVDIAGIPAPKTCWLFNNFEEVKESENLKIFNSQGKSQLLILSAHRKFIGNYKLTAENEFGFDEAELIISEVKSCPDPPCGPLNVTKRGTNCFTLDWIPPAFNGGSPVEFYNVRRFDPDENDWILEATTPTSQIELNESRGKNCHFFHISAVNSIGESLPLEIGQGIVFESEAIFCKKPRKPDAPKVKYFGPDCCEVSWQNPEDQVTEYVLEIKNLSEKGWKKMARVPGNICNYQIQDFLTPGHDYKVRLTSLIRGFSSDPSHSSEIVHGFDGPRVEMLTPRNRVFKEGQSFTINVVLSGFPEPSITWLNPDRSKLDTNERVKIIQSRKCETSLEIQDAKRNDSGNYILLVGGNFEAPIDLIVVSSPGRPQPPLKVHNVTTTSCRLSWKPPLDNGGSPIQYYSIEKLNVGRGTWIPIGRGSFHKREFEVSDLKNGTTWKFRVIAVNDVGHGEPLESDFVDLSDSGGCPEPPEVIRVDDLGLSWVNLSWDNPPSDSVVTGFVIEQNVEDSLVWQRLTITQDCHARIRNLMENCSYKFRVRAIGQFGIGPPSFPSSNIVCCNKRSAPEVKKLLNSDLIKVTVGEPFHLGVRVSGGSPSLKEWSFNGVKISETSLHIMTNDGNTSKLLMANPRNQDSGTYGFRASNPDGEDQVEFKVMVIGYPSIPEGPLEVTTICSDKCLLAWKKSSFHGGSPISHYLVEKSNFESKSWTICERVSSTSCFVRDLDVFDKYIFRVRAVNSYGESQPLLSSEMVNPRSLPDPPSKPMVTCIRSNCFEIRWEESGNSQSKYFIIEKRLSGEDFWTGSGKAYSKFWIFHSPDQDETCFFRIRGVNDAGIGPPGTPSDRVSYSVPKVESKVQGSLKVKLGDPVRLEVEIQGEPQPEVVWSKDGKRVDYRNVTALKNASILTIGKSTIKDFGNYTIFADNIHGKAECLVRIREDEKNPPPEGPLKVKAITKSKWKLNWNPPKGKNRSVTLGYVVEMNEVESGVTSYVGFSTTPEILIADGLKQNANYLFFVRALSSKGEESENLKTLMPITVKFDKHVPDPPSGW